MNANASERTSGFRVAAFRQYAGGDAEVRLYRIRNHASDLWERGMLLHPFFTLHGPSHSMAVETLVGDLLPVDTQPELKDLVTPGLAFCLLAAAWLHDIGMITQITPEEREQAASAELEISAWVRLHHHTRSASYVRDNHTNLGLEVEEASRIAGLVAAHRRTVCPRQRVRNPGVNLAAAVIRIADELDLGRHRTPNALLENIWSEMDQTSRWHWITNWCVKSASSFYVTTHLEHGTRRALARTLRIVLPDHRMEKPFREHLLEPISRALDKEEINLVLAAHGLEVRVENFETITTVVDKLLPDGTSLHERLSDFLEGKYTRELASFAVWRTNTHCSPPGAYLLHQATERVFYICRHDTSAVDWVESNVDELLSNLLEARSEEAAQNAMHGFENALREVLETAAQSWKGVHVDDLELEAKNLCTLAWRLRLLGFPEARLRLLNLNYLAFRLGRRACDLVAWLAEHDPEPRIVACALHHLRVNQCSTGFSVALKQTQHPDWQVKEAAARYLGKLGLDDLRAEEALRQLANADATSRVREAARRALNEFRASTAKNLASVGGRHLIIAGSDGSALAREKKILTHLGVEIRQLVEVGEIASMVEEWPADCVLLNLLAADLREQPKEVDNPFRNRVHDIVSAIRERADLQTPIILVSDVDDAYLSELLRHSGLIVMKQPTPTQRLVDRICDVLEG